MEIIHKEESYAIIGACFEVYKVQGCGFLEQVYQECLQFEFALRGIPFVPKFPLQLSYKGQPLEQKYQPDIVVFDKIILEVKALATLADPNRAQLHNYLRATGLKLGLLVNFGSHPKLEYERIVY